MGSQEPDDERRDDEDMQEVEPGNDDSIARIVASKQEEAQVGADQWYRLDDRIGDPDTGTGYQVVGEGVAQEPIDDAQQQHGHAHDPVELARLAERTGEEHPSHMHRDRAQEDVGGPMVGLAHQQAGLHVEGKPDRRGIGLGYLLALEREIAAVIDDLVGGGNVVQRQEHTGSEQHHKRIQGDFPQHERPVVGEDLVEECPAALGDTQAVVDPSE